MTWPTNPSSSPSTSSGHYGARKLGEASASRKSKIKVQKLKSKSEKEIIYFFQEYIFGFIYNDIQNCIKAGANYVVALALLSYTEFLGGLITGNLGLDRKSSENFNQALKYFPREYCDLNSRIKVEFTDTSNRKDTKEDIYSIFRCGLAHEYFIKGRKFSCVWNNPNGFTAKHIGIKKEKGGLIFYNNEYFRDFKKAVMKFYEELIADKNKIKITSFSNALNRLESRKLI